MVSFSHEAWYIGHNIYQQKSPACSPTNIWFTSLYISHFFPFDILQALSI